MEEVKNSAYYARIRREKLIDDGLCPACGKTNDTDGYYCKKCTDERKEYSKLYYAGYQQAGVCPKCRKNSILGDEKTCPECRAIYAEAMTKYIKKNREQWNEYQKKMHKKAVNERREKGLCVRCGRKREDQRFKNCERCRKTMREQSRDKREKLNITSREYRRENGLCFFCGEPVVDGLKVCERCRQRNKAAANSENAVKARQRMKEEGRGFYMHRNGGRR